ncbi:hypothetical protein [Falsiroseomonas sp. HW251]|uniref:hypothetical protein n=1 Tax=Falsiroseomonas sp. HW251 TaxID=3390998 RepID=UPI003D313246
MPFLSATPALGCGVPALAPVPVTLGQAPDAVGTLVAPVGWEAGDPAAVLLSAASFRDGCAEPRTAALLEAGAMVLALDPAVAARNLRALAAATILREGFAAGEVALMWPAAASCAAPAVQVTWPPTRICARRSRLVSAVQAGGEAGLGSG